MSKKIASYAVITALLFAFSIVWIIQTVATWISTPFTYVALVGETACEMIVEAGRNVRKNLKK